MRGHGKEKRRGKSLAYRIFYITAVALIAAAWICAFRSYFRYYDSLHPEIAWALPWVQADVTMANGIFLWDESVVTTPRAGTVSYPMGTAPVRVYKGAVVAKISSGGVVREIKSPTEGYFVAGTDGREGDWRYTALWRGADSLPNAGHVSTIRDGASLKSGAVIGKIVPQPQNLRFIGYADLTGDLEKKLETNRVMVKMDALDTPSHAQVRVYEKLGHRVKMYLGMPWFPPDLLLSRNHRLMIEAGEASGVVVPESAVTMRDGRVGAFVIKGYDAVFRDVDGRVIDGGRYLVMNGVKLGDAVVVDADTAKEGRVKLW
jgi:hypothetical protein